MIRKLRRDKGITQRELAEMLGVDRTAISKWEQGIAFPYESIEEYIVKTYSDGTEMYEKLSKRYTCEIKEYHGKEKTFEELFGRKEFL